MGPLLLPSPLPVPPTTPTVDPLRDAFTDFGNAVVFVASGVTFIIVVIAVSVIVLGLITSAVDHAKGHPLR